MRIASLEIKNFRSFASFKHTFAGPLTLIEGPNGSGKTSLLEALHYLCYGKSFRTSSAEEMMQHASENFFIKVEVILNDAEHHTLQIGFSREKRTLKIDGKQVSTYKELIRLYKSITVTEDDIATIQGAPELRRMFLDQAMVLHQPEFISLLRLYKKVLKQRTALFTEYMLWDQASYEIWTEKLWKLAEEISCQRADFLGQLELEINSLIAQFFPGIPAISLLYKKNSTMETVESWMLLYSFRERQAKRTLFGPHTDDFEILLAGKSSKNYASRGQQKLLAVLLKIAHFSLLKQPVIILLDDFMTDFDDKRLCALLDLFITKKAHLICTVPTTQSPLAAYLTSRGSELLQLDVPLLPHLQTASDSNEIKNYT